ncbi:MAG: hypothetical protein F2842_08515 [Actinobacteria bacterium]|uniref:Unannotated protein n=1 Tax=freshwater metagenome TaxID=449393 RepID=A0A6J7KIQ0_9ZZZZ|nr:hypothetical protein [Actinomycetota bacterium]
MNKTKRIVGSLLLLASVLAMAATTIDAFQYFQYFSEADVPYKVALVATLLAPILALGALVLCALAQRAIALGLVIATGVVNVASTALFVVSLRSIYEDSFDTASSLKFLFLGLGTNDDGSTAFWPGLFFYSVGAVALLIGAIVVLATASKQPTLAPVGDPTVYAPPSFGTSPVVNPSFEEGENV